MIRFVSRRRGKPFGFVSATDLAEFSVCPYNFILKKVMGTKITPELIEGVKAHRELFKSHSKDAKILSLDQAVNLAKIGKTMVGMEIEVIGSKIYGIIDKITIHGKNAEITEYKRNMSDYAKTQVLSYALAVSDKFENIAVNVVSWRNKEVMWERDVKDSDLIKIKRLVEEYFNAVRTGTFRKGSCNSCLFRQRCLNNYFEI